MRRNEQGLVSVALSAFNAQATIIEALRSLLNQRYGNFEIFLVDDASQDATVDLVLATINDPRLSMIRLSQNIGTYAAKNLVLRNFAHGEYFALQDADDISHPDRFAMQVAALGEGLYDACGCAIDEFGTTADFRSRFSHDKPVILSDKDGHYHKTNAYPDVLFIDDLLEPSVPATDLKLAMNGSLMFRAAAILELGGFDGRKKIGADTEMLIRLAVGHKVGNLAQTLYSRRFHPASLTAQPKTCFGSPARMAVANSIDKLRADLKRLKDANEQALLNRAVLSDLFVPDVAYDVISLGV